MADLLDEPVLALWTERFIGCLRLRSTVRLGLDRPIVGRDGLRLLRYPKNRETQQDRENQVQGSVSSMHTSSQCVRNSTSECQSCQLATHRTLDAATA